MACDFLAVSGNIILLCFKRTFITFLLVFSTATSVPVERVFSGGADLIAPKRCSLGGDVIRACMCLKSWWNIKNKNNF